MHPPPVLLHVAFPLSGWTIPTAHQCITPQPHIRTPARYSHTDKFPYVGGLVPVVLSWVVSPVLAGLVAAVLFLITRTLVLRRKNSTAISYWALPAFVLFTIYINGEQF